VESGIRRTGTDSKKQGLDKGKHSDIGVRPGTRKEQDRTGTRTEVRPKKTTRIKTRSK
jgi:hypothetical protein